MVVSPAKVILCLATILCLLIRGPRPRWEGRPEAAVLLVGLLLIFTLVVYSLVLRSSYEVGLGGSVLALSVDSMELALVVFVARRLWLSLGRVPRAPIFLGSLCLVGASYGFTVAFG